MTDREKLTELVNDILNFLPWGQISSHTAQEVADHLIENGAYISKPCDAAPSKEWKFTNADKIRAMSAYEMAAFFASQMVNMEQLKMNSQGYVPTATQLSVLGETLYNTWVHWLLQSAKEE